MIIALHYSKLRPVLNFSCLQQCVRTVTVSAATDKLQQTEFKSFREIPGPSSLPIMGPFLHFMPGGSLHNINSTELTHKLYDIYGPIVRIDSMFSKDAIVLLYDAESAGIILRNENNMPIRIGFKSLSYYRQKYKKSENDRTDRPTGLVSDHGELWKSFRSAVNPVLLQPKTIRLYSSALEEVATDMVERLRSLRDENNRIRGQFDQEMNLWSLESIGVVALGNRLNCFDSNLQDDSPVKRLIECVHQMFVLSNELDLKPSIWTYVSTPLFRKTMKMYEEQENLTKYFIKKALDDIKMNKSKSDDEKPVLEKLLDINEEYAYIMASDMLVAGVDTTSNTMSATLYLMAINQDKQQKLREEVMSKNGKRSYLRACIKEAMRILPVVSGNMRRTTKEYNILGYHIPENVDIAFAHQHLSMMEKYYPRPTEFIPERWLTNKSDPLYYGNAHPFANSPFGFGVRSCIGRRIAELEVETFLSKIVENFQVEWSGSSPRVEQTSINYFKGPFNFIFKDL
ncbi:cytochrome P450 CYP12A2-like [Bombyx mandarina]|uniref:Cytochrome P450 CYP12A2-like n=1 Tax=Bombyx mandarina TaxID=7092 RepID=A0A6J2JG31_BOMMA|nr:cytochrome P450 CYP12A2-like [Bombyx mandarina]